jgi:VWFA-related protein
MRTSAVLTLALAAGTASVVPVLRAQGPQERPTFTVSVDLVSTDMIPRDSRTGQFIADLKSHEIEVYEDGVKQTLATIELIHGGRPFSVLGLPAAPAPEGIILPRSKPTSDTAGRVFLLFIDDLHLNFQQTARTRTLVRDISKKLIHDGDMFGIVSTGTSSLSIQLTYDRQVLDSAIERISGGGLTPKEIIQGAQGSNGPTEVRHRAHVAFSTANDLMQNLAKLKGRRKAVIYISSGYDFNPFERGRLEETARRWRVENADDLASDPFYRNEQSQQALAATDLVGELVELTRAANRANAAIYTIDPRGLVAGQDIDQEVDQRDWNAHVRETQDSLRVLSEETGGTAVVNQNDFGKALARIDAETSDYYVIGYYSNNPDPLKRTRKLEVRTTRPGLTVVSRAEYTLPPSRQK